MKPSTTQYTGSYSSMSWQSHEKILRMNVKIIFLCSMSLDWSITVQQRFKSHLPHRWSQAGGQDLARPKSITSMNWKRVANKYLINLYHVQTKMSLVNRRWLRQINKSWSSSCAEAHSLVKGAAELAAPLLWCEGVCTVQYSTVSATQR